MQQLVTMKAGKADEEVSRSQDIIQALDGNESRYIIRAAY
jgi:hypothetical protein